MGATAPRSRRTRSSKKRGPAGTTSDAIYMAAENLFFEYGYEGTSLRDVADEVGLQVGSLYNHIASKEQLLLEIMRGSMNELTASVAKAVAEHDEPVARLQAFMKATIIFHGERSKQAFIGNTELRSLPADERKEIQDLRDTFEGQLVELLRDCRAAGVSIPDIRLASYSCIAIASYVASWYKPEGRLTLDQIADGLIENFTPLSAAGTAVSANSSLSSS